LVPRRPYSTTVTRKGSTRFVAPDYFPKHESVSLVITKLIVVVVTPESGLVLEELMITPTPVVITLAVMEIMDGGISKRWDTSLCSDKELTFTLC